MPNVNQWLWAARAAVRIFRPVAKEANTPKAAAADVVESSIGAQDQVAASYQARIDQLESARNDAIHERERFLKYGAILCIVSAVLLYLSLSSHFLPVWSVAFPLVPAIVAFAGMGRFKRRIKDSTCLLGFYHRGLDRVRHEWMGKGDDGLDLEMPNHLCARDIDLFGDGSMFELLCEVGTPAGREALAKWLQSPARPEEVISRQQSVRCLRERIDLREKLVLMREGEARDYSWNELREWLEASPAKFPRWAPLIAFLLPIVMGLAGVCWWGGILQPADAAWLIAAVAATEAVLALSLRTRVQSVLTGLLLPYRKVDSLRRMCALVIDTRLESPQLIDLQRRLRGSPELIAGLQRRVYLLELRRNDWICGLLLLLLWTTQWAIRIDQWRRRHGQELVEWIIALGEFEALMSVAVYAYENPEDPNPNFDSEGQLFEAAAMGHPLMDARTCVRNDVRLGGEIRFLLVTGSNMSGKSTLLRAVGLNAMLASLGAPVRAARLRLSQLQVCASIRIEDSLLDGVSRFYAEVQRLKTMLDCAASDHSVLFLIDELFGGTNSADRRIAAEAVIRSLVNRQAIGLVTSHDLALSEIGEMNELRGANVHFTDSPISDGLSFDYRIRQGKLDHGNALKIIKLVGLGK